MKLSVIIPVFNEAVTIIDVIQRIENVSLQEGILKEIIVVDDGSTDGTTQKLQALEGKPGLRIFCQETNQGKTAAVREGIKQSTGDFIVIQDADLEYDPKYYPRLLEPILNQGVSVVYGSRFKGKIEGMTWINRIANTISNKTINWLFKSQLTDFHTGFKMFKADILKNTAIISSGFTFDTEITARLLKEGLDICEVPIQYSARSCQEGKKMTWIKALQTYWFLWQFRFSHIS